MKRNSQGKYDFFSLCVLEMKNRGSEKTTDALIERVLRGGSRGECISDTEEFELAVPDNGYRTQLCQHATALGVDHVMMVYSLPGAQIKKMVHVTVSAEHREDLLHFQQIHAKKYMPFTYVENAVQEIPSLGKDFSKAYGYAQEHHTLELYLQLWLAHFKDIMANGTPPPCRRLVDLSISYWNKCMGNVDIVCKVMKKRNAVCGSDSGPGSLMWFELFGYALYNGFRLLQHGELDQKIDQFKTFKSFKKTRQKRTFTSFLFKLANGECFNENTMVNSFPGLREFINHGNTHAESAVDQIQALSLTDNSTTNLGTFKFVKNEIEPYLKPGNPLFIRRLDASQRHISGSFPKGYKQSTCILCCELCIKGKCRDNTSVSAIKTKRMSRHGRKTNKYCITCRVTLCKHCHTTFHTEQVSLPAYSRNHALVPDEPTARAMVTPFRYPSPSIAELALTLTSMRHQTAPSLRTVQGPSSPRRRSSKRLSSNSAVALPRDISQSFTDSPTSHQSPSRQTRGNKCAKIDAFLQRRSAR